MHEDVTESNNQEVQQSNEDACHDPQNRSLEEAVTAWTLRPERHRLIAEQLPIAS